MTYIPRLTVDCAFLLVLNSDIDGAAVGITSSHNYNRGDIGALLCTLSSKLSCTHSLFKAEFCKRRLAFFYRIQYTGNINTNSRPSHLADLHISNVFAAK